MQSWTGNQAGWGSTVKGIAEQGESKSIGVDTDLVGASGGGYRCDKRIAIEALEKMKCCLGGLPLA